MKISTLMFCPYRRRHYLDSQKNMYIVGGGARCSEHIHSQSVVSGCFFFLCLSGLRQPSVSAVLFW